MPYYMSTSGCTHSTIWLRPPDGDNDGTSTAEDCNDTDPDSTIIAEDADCDGVLTTVDGAEVPLDGEGGFATEVAPAWGLNVHELVARDAVGNVSSTFCSYFASARYVAEDATLADAILLHLSQGAVDDGAPDRPQPAGPGPEPDSAPERGEAPGAGPRTVEVSDEESRDVEMTEEGEAQGGGDEAGAAGEEDEDDQSDWEDAMDTS